MKNLKVCMIIEAWFPLIGGGQIHTLELSNRLTKEHGCDVDIITRAIKGENCNKSTFGEKLNDNIKLHRVYPTLAYGNLFGRLWFILSSFFFLLRNNYDIIHVHGVLPIIPVKLANMFKRKRIVLTIHGTRLGVERRDIRGKLRNMIERKLTCGLIFDGIITTSRDFLVNKNVNKNIHVIPNGVDINKFDSVSVGKNKKFKIIYVGRFDKIKGVDFLIKGFKDALKIYSDMELHLVGYGFDENALKKLVEKLNLQNNVFFRGKITGIELIKEYKSSHLFILPSLSEGQPLTLLEAWAAKLPVIVTSVGANIDIVNEENGFMIPPKSSESIANAIINAREKENLQMIGINGYELVKKEFTWDNTTKKVYRVYKNITITKATKNDE